MILDHRVNVARSRNSCGAAGGDGVPFGIFHRIISGLSGLELSLTCRQGAFAERSSEEGNADACGGKKMTRDAENPEMHEKKYPDARGRMEGAMP